jgi:hypothetical protein
VPPQEEFDTTWGILDPHSLFDWDALQEKKSLTGGWGGERIWSHRAVPATTTQLVVQTRVHIYPESGDRIAVETQLKGPERFPSCRMIRVGREARHPDQRNPLRRTTGYPATGTVPDRDESDGASSDVTSHRHEPR